MSKGGTKTVQTQSSVPAFIEPFYERGLSEAQRLYEQPGPSYFPGSTVVSMAPETQSALSMARDRAIAGSPLTRQAQQYTQDVLEGSSWAPTHSFSKCSIRLLERSPTR